MKMRLYLAVCLVTISSYSTLTLAQDGSTTPIAPIDLEEPPRESGGLGPITPGGSESVFENTGGEQFGDNVGEQEPRTGGTTGGAPADGFPNSLGGSPDPIEETFRDTIGGADFTPYDDTLANLWGSWDIKTTPLAFDLWKFARMSTFIPFVLLAAFTGITFLVSCFYVAAGVFGSSPIFHGGRNYEPGIFSQGEEQPPEWWKVLSKAYSRIGYEHLKINRRVNIMFGLSIGSISVSLGVSILLFDSLMRGGQSNSFALFGFISPIILFQAIALFFIRTSMKLQDGLDRTRKELNSIQSLMASASASSESNEALSEAFSAHRDTKSERDFADTDKDGKQANDSPNVDPRVVAAAINAASKAGF
jgi:hypothetical protein